MSDCCNLRRGRAGPYLVDSYVSIGSAPICLMAVKGRGKHVVMLTPRRKKNRRVTVTAYIATTESLAAVQFEGVLVSADKTRWQEHKLVGDVLAYFDSATVSAMRAGTERISIEVSEEDSWSVHERLDDGDLLLSMTVV